MALPRREWIRTFSDPEVLSDLFAAARDCMGRICHHEPSECDCELNRFTPQEFAEFIELEVHREAGKPLHLRPAGQPNRRRNGHMRDLRSSLSTAI